MIMFMLFFTRENESNDMRMWHDKKVGWYFSSVQDSQAKHKTGRNKRWDITISPFEKKMSVIPQILYAISNTLAISQPVKLSPLTLQTFVFSRFVRLCDLEFWPDNKEGPWDESTLTRARPFFSYTPPTITIKIFVFKLAVLMHIFLISYSEILNFLESCMYIKRPYPNLCESA